MTTYIDNILINSDSLENDRGYIQSMLDMVSKARLCLKTKESKFHKQEVKYLGLIVEKGKDKMD